MSDIAKARPRKKAPPIWVWLLLVGIVIGSLSLKLSWDVERASIDRDNEQAKDRFVLEGDKKFREIDALIGSLHGAEQPEIEKALGIDPTLVLKASGSGHEANWVDPLYGVRVKLYFDSDGKLSGNSVGWGSHAFTAKPNTQTKLQQMIKQLGRWMCPVLGGVFLPIVYVVWIPLLVVYRVRPHRRSVSSVFVLGWALFCPLIWLMASFSLLSAYGIMSYDANLWGLVMFVVTLIALYRGGVSDRYPPGACQYCGYNLMANTSGRCPECGAAVDVAQLGDAIEKPG